MFNFIRNCQKISHSGGTISHISFESASAPHPCQLLFVISLFSLSRSDGRKKVSHCTFNLFSLIPNEVDQVLWVS